MARHHSAHPRVEPVVDATISPGALKDHSLRNQLGQGFPNFCNHAANPLFQEPPFGDTLNRVLGIWMGAQIAQYL
jgi:hypothetical protein